MFLNGLNESNINKEYIENELNELTMNKEDITLSFHAKKMFDLITKNKDISDFKKEKIS